MLFQPCLVYKIGKWLSVFAKTIDLIRTSRIPIEVIEIYFKEMNLLFNVLKDNFIMGIVFGCFKDSCKKELIQMSYLVYIKEDSLGFLSSNDLFIKQRRSKIRNDNTKITDIIFLGLK